MNKKTNLFVSIVATVVVAIYCAEAEIMADLDTQAVIDSIAAQMGGGRASQQEGLNALKRIEESHTNMDAFIQQVILYLRWGANTEERGYGAMGIINQLNADKTTMIRAVLPYLEASDCEVQRIATHVLRSVDKDKLYNEGVDFSLYSSFLERTPTNPPVPLIYYMYDRNPQAAIIMVARIFSPEVSESEVATMAKSSVNESVAYFTRRTEWWAHLYVTEMLEKEPSMLTLDILDKLWVNDNPIVQEKVDILREKLMQQIRKEEAKPLGH